MSSIFSKIGDGVSNAYHRVTTILSGIFHDDIEPALMTFFHVIESNGGAVLIKLALQVVAGAAAGTPFGTLTTTLIASAKEAGIEVAEIAAKSALQVAQTQLQAELAAKTETPAPAPESPAGA